MRRTVDGCDDVWPDPIGSGWSSCACGTCAGGRNAVRGAAAKARSSASPGVTRWCTWPSLRAWQSGAMPDDDLPGRGDFPVWWPMPTRWADNDQYGHANNVVYYAWFDTAVNGWLMRELGADV